MPDQTPGTCPVCHMAGDHKLSCPERKDGQLRVYANLPALAPSMPPLPKPYVVLGPQGDAYSADQMHAYAQAVADERVRAALTERRAEGGGGEFFEPWWSVHMPNATRDQAWTAYINAAFDAAPLLYPKVFLAADRYAWLRTPPNNLNPAIYGPTGGLLRRDTYLDAAIDAQIPTPSLDRSKEPAGAALADLPTSQPSKDAEDAARYRHLLSGDDGDILDQLIKHAYAGGYADHNEWREAADQLVDESRTAQAHKGATP